jgi:hypothetical protein
VSAHPLAGPRQTVDRCIHPTLGPGVAIYENGPALFAPDQGEPVPMKSIRFGGAGSTYWNLNAVTEDGHVFVLNAHEQERGATHKRFWSPMLGPGWLVYLGRALKVRFEADNGTVVPIEAVIWKTGKPGKEPKRPRKPGQAKSPELLEWEEWNTYETRDGDVFVLRRNGPPPAKEEAPAETQMGLGLKQPGERR